MLGTISITRETNQHLIEHCIALLKLQPERRQQAFGLSQQYRLGSTEERNRRSRSIVDVILQA